MIGVTHIRDLRSCFPERILTTEDLKKKNPSWDVEKLVTITGIRSRHRASDGETALDLGYRAVRGLLEKTAVPADSLDAILFATTTPDHVMPFNAALLHNKLGLSSRVAAFDFTLACTGFVYGLAIARSFIESLRMRRILLVTADTISRYCHPSDRWSEPLVGDGACATLIEEADRDSGIDDILLGTDSRFYQSVFVPAGAMRLPRSNATANEIRDEFGNVRTSNDIFIDGLSIRAFARKQVPAQVKTLLERNQLSLSDLKLVLFHQASRAVLNLVIDELGLAASQTFFNLDDKGSIGSASMPCLLEDAVQRGLLKRGDRVLLVTFGAGLSWAHCLMRW